MNLTRNIMEDSVSQPSCVHSLRHPLMKLSRFPHGPMLYIARFMNVMTLKLETERKHYPGYHEETGPRWGRVEQWKTPSERNSSFLKQLGLSHISCWRYIPTNLLCLKEKPTISNPMHGSSSLLHLDGQPHPKRTPIQLTLRHGLHLHCLHLQQESLVAVIKLGPEHTPSDLMSVRVQPLYETWCMHGWHGWCRCCTCEW